jgi:hypothetical protein
MFFRNFGSLSPNYTEHRIIHIHGCYNISSKEGTVIKKVSNVYNLALSAGWFIILGYVSILGHICCERNNLPVSVGARRYSSAA